MKRITTWAVAVLCLIIVVLMLTSSRWLVPYLHDRTLAGFSSEIERLTIPAGTTRNEFMSQLGQQSGNGDHCDYLAAIMLNTNMTKGEAESYFQQRYTGIRKLKFLWGDEMETYASPANDITGIHPIQDWIKGRSKDDTTNLIVYIYEPGLTSSWDYRCR